MRYSSGTTKSTVNAVCLLSCSLICVTAVQMWVCLVVKNMHANICRVFFSVGVYCKCFFSGLTGDECSCCVPLKCFIVRIIAIECFLGEMVVVKIPTMLFFFSVGFVGCMLCIYRSVHTYSIVK